MLDVILHPGWLLGLGLTLMSFLQDEWHEPESCGHGPAQCALSECQPPGSAHLPHTQPHPHPRYKTNTLDQLLRYFGVTYSVTVSKSSLFVELNLGLWSAIQACRWPSPAWVLPWAPFLLPSRWCSPWVHWAIEGWCAACRRGTTPCRHLPTLIWRAATSDTYCQVECSLFVGFLSSLLFFEGWL